MGVYKLSSAGGLATPRTNYSSFLAGNPRFIPNSYESIATVTVGSGGAASVTFSSIPTTFKHLQIRFIGRTARAETISAVGMQLTTSNTSPVYEHALFGDGSSVYSSALNAYVSDGGILVRIAGNNAGANVFGAGIIDIFDYASTTKNKTVKGLGGIDNNGGGQLNLNSRLFTTTSAIDQIKLNAIFTGGSTGTTTFNEHSQFALYGIKD
jgi:hypothetical protein